MSLLDFSHNCIAVIPRLAVYKGMRLSDLMAESSAALIIEGADNPELEVSGLTTDSRAVEQGYLFIAIKGTETDGHEYIPQAIESGAVAILCENPPSDIPEEIIILKSSDIRRDTSLLATAFYEDPSEDLIVLGVTGTNGKTTTAFLIDSLIRSKFGRCGMIGTVSVDEGRGPKPATHTTPDAISLQKSLAQMVENHCPGVAIELSSHGIEQGRCADLSVNTAVFTNLTQDHLDYHGSMEAYYQAKKLLFTQLGRQPAKQKACALINVDDQYGERLSEELTEEFPNLKQLTFGFGVKASLRATDIKQSAKGSEFRLDHGGKSYRVRTPLIGLFNIRNIVCALGSVVMAKLLNMREAVAAIGSARQVPGRLERVSTSGMDYSVFVDYAHTPDALANVCQTLKELGPDRLITVFGCGGDRDIGKRPLMAKAANTYSDLCIVTSDNPRTEDPISIVKQIEEGFAGGAHRTLLDRRKAIQTAIDLAKPGDIILIAGKGHEDYQIYGTTKMHFDDRHEAKDAIVVKRAKLAELLNKDEPKFEPRKDDLRPRRPY